MEQNYKAIIVFALIVIALFAGGLYYIFKENQNHKITLDLVQEYLVTNNKERSTYLEGEIKRRIVKRRIALTSYASFESFDTLMSNAYGCDQVAKRELQLDPLNESRTYDEIWRDCMDNPEQLPSR